MLGGDVFGFAGVVGDVVEFGVVDESPAVGADGAVLEFGAGCCVGSPAAYVDEEVAVWPF